MPTILLILSHSSENQLNNAQIHLETTTCNCASQMGTCQKTYFAWRRWFSIFSFAIFSSNFSPVRSWACSLLRLCARASTQQSSRPSCLLQKLQKIKTWENVTFGTFCYIISKCESTKCCRLYDLALSGLSIKPPPSPYHSFTFTFTQINIRTSGDLF